jgi:hypothetical protein
MEHAGEDDGVPGLRKPEKGLKLRDRLCVRAVRSVPGLRKPEKGLKRGFPPKPKENAAASQDSENPRRD